MADDGLMTGNIFGQADVDPRRGNGPGTWQHGRPPAADPAPAATPDPAPGAAGMPAQSLLERIADGGALGDGEHATFEAS
jgi:hypothetical protein